MALTHQKTSHFESTIPPPSIRPVRQRCGGPSLGPWSRAGSHGTSKWRRDLGRAEGRPDFRGFSEGLHGFNGHFMRYFVQVFVGFDEWGSWGRVSSGYLVKFHEIRWGLIWLNDVLKAFMENTINIIGVRQFDHQYCGKNSTWSLPFRFFHGWVFLVLDFQSQTQNVTVWKPGLSDWACSMTGTIFQTLWNIFTFHLEKKPGSIDCLRIMLPCSLQRPALFAGFPQNLRYFWVVSSMKKSPWTLVPCLSARERLWRHLEKVVDKLWGSTAELMGVTMLFNNVYNMGVNLGLYQWGLNHVANTC